MWRKRLTASAPTWRVCLFSVDDCVGSYLMAVCIYGYGRVWVGAFFYSDHVTYRREKRLRRKMLDQVHIALSLRPGSSHSEAGLMSCLPEKPGAGAGPLQRP